MPEGDTIARLARNLNEEIAGEVLLGSDFRVPAHATANLADWTITDVAARGKHLLIRAYGPRDSQRLTIHSHLRMDGSWRLVPRGADEGRTRARRFSGADVRVVLTLAKVYAVARAVSGVRLLPTADEAAFLSHLGPDPLGADWDVAAAVRRLQASAQQQVATALLDQRIMAGIGNVYRCEVLFLMGISPQRLVEQVDDLAAVVECAATLLQENVNRRWRVTTGVDRRGHELWVYARAGQPCRRCGRAVRSGNMGAGAPNAHDAPRVVFWCPNCQK